MLVEAACGEDVASIGDGLAVAVLVVGAAGGGAWELAAPAKVTVEVNVDISRDGAADAGSVCEACETGLALGVEVVEILVIAADCGTALKLCTEVLGNPDVLEYTTPSSVSATLGSMHPIVMPDWPPSIGSAKHLWPSGHG